MDNEKIAKELVAVARELTAGYRSEFKVVKPLMLEREPAGTNTSLENLRRILEAGYSAVDGIYSWDKTQAEWMMEVFFRNPEFDDVVSHKFYGFSVGYGGQGPRGTMDAGMLMGYKFREENVFGNGLPESGKIKLRNL